MLRKQILSQLHEFFETLTLLSKANEDSIKIIESNPTFKDTIYYSEIKEGLTKQTDMLVKLGSLKEETLTLFNETADKGIAVVGLAEISPKIKEYNDVMAEYAALSNSIQVMYKNTFLPLN